MIDIRERVFEVLENTHLMSLAVVDKDGPWVADVVFIYDKDFNIFWMSDPEARHSRAISNSFKAAGSITNSVKSKEPNFGLQFSGVAEELVCIGERFTRLPMHSRRSSRWLPAAAGLGCYNQGERTSCHSDDPWGANPCRHTSCIPTRRNHHTGLR